MDSAKVCNTLAWVVMRSFSFVMIFYVSVFRLRALNVLANSSSLSVRTL